MPCRTLWVTCPLHHDICMPLEAQVANASSAMPAMHARIEKQPVIEIFWLRALLIVRWKAGMFSLTTWLMKSRRAPWNTSKTGQSWHSAAQRYLEVAPVLS